MKWVMIVALWNTNPPQDSFSFYTEAFNSEVECLEAVQIVYAEAFNRGVQAQAICKSEVQLNLHRDRI